MESKTEATMKDNRNMDQKQETCFKSKHVSKVA